MTSFLLLASGFLDLIHMAGDVFAAFIIACLTFGALVLGALGTLGGLLIALLVACCGICCMYAVVFILECFMHALPDPPKETA